MTSYLIWLTIATGVTTFLLRAFPFILFDRGQKSSSFLEDIGKLISPAAIAMLIVYCFSAYFDNTTFAAKHYGAAEWIAALVVILLHLKWRNPMISIIFGTALYMVLIQKLLV
ncbi:MAG: AzlD domain-containing protein [Lentisphaeria bacterium]|nr:AzlD domain-containing protein [Lentisphaeria bacterium]